jgi:hypothetical protein
VSGLAQKVGDYPVLLPELYRFGVQAEQLAAAKSASDQHGQDGVIPLGAEGITVCTGQKPLALLSGEPVPDADSNRAYPFHASDPGCKLRTKQAGVGGLIRDPPNGGKAQVDRSWRVVLLFEIDPVSEDDRAIEREAGL